MPLGQPYPPAAEAGAPQAVSPGTPGPTPVLGALQAFSGSGAPTQVQHTSLTGTAGPWTVQAQRFSATAVVVDNRSSTQLIIGFGRRPTWAAASYDAVVMPGELRVLRTPPTKTVFVGTSQQAVDPAVLPSLPYVQGMVDVWLLSGSAAALVGPSCTARPGYATYFSATAKKTSPGAIAWTESGPTTSRLGPFGGACLLWRLAVSSIDVTSLHLTTPQPPACIVVAPGWRRGTTRSVAFRVPSSGLPVDVAGALVGNLGQAGGDMFVGTTLFAPPYTHVLSVNIAVVATPIGPLGPAGFIR